MGFCSAESTILSVEANASKSTQVADLTLEIEILIELWAEVLYLAVSRLLWMQGSAELVTNPRRLMFYVERERPAKLYEFVCVKSLVWICIIGDSTQLELCHE